MHGIPIAPLTPTIVRTPEQIERARAAALRIRQRVKERKGGPWPLATLDDALGTAAKLYRVSLPGE